MPTPPNSPLVTHVSWGRMDVAGLGSGKDFKLYPGGGRGKRISSSRMMHWLSQNTSAPTCSTGVLR